MDRSYMMMPSKETHKREFLMEWELTRRLMDYDLIARRDDRGMFSPSDINIDRFNYEHCEWGNRVAVVDVERKLNVRLQNGIPKNWISCGRGVSYLDRKISDETRSGKMIYLLFDDDPINPSVVWNLFEDIRVNAIFSNRGNVDQIYWEMRPDKCHLVNIGWDSLISYLSKL